MAKKKKNKPNPNLNGLTDRHVSAIIRRKMITRDHGNMNVYSRKTRHKEDPTDQD